VEIFGSAWFNQGERDFNGGEGRGKGGERFNQTFFAWLGGVKGRYFI